MQGPQLVIMVPTRELGVQIVMLIYKLFGGAVNSQVPGDAANMFTYKGPRGLKARLTVLAQTFDSSSCAAWLHCMPCPEGFRMPSNKEGI